MTAQTRTEVTMNTAPNAASWMSRLSMRPSSQFDEGRAAPESLVPGGPLVRTVALCFALAVSAVALAGMAAHLSHPESLASATSPAAGD
jgi:hypothetical protein